MHLLHFHFNDSCLTGWLKIYFSIMLQKGVKLSPGLDEVLLRVDVRVEELKHLGASQVREE